jgi:SPX domain protein involved in polyphosphate accumulation
LAASLALHIERREFKYLIDDYTAERVRRFIGPFCELDKNARHHGDRRYLIDSLYFDTPDMRLYRANDEEVTNRFKLRVRTYPTTPGAPVFFEVKARYHDVVVKDRGRAPKNWPALLAPGVGAIQPGSASFESAAVERFATLVRMHHARPVVLVRYTREPYESTIDDYARVTLDRAIQSQLVDQISMEPTPGRWRPSDTGERMESGFSPTVLELKFTTHVPIWMVDMVRALELDRRSFSKYGRSIEAWSEHPDGRRVLNHRAAAGWSR